MKIERWFPFLTVCGFFLFYAGTTARRHAEASDAANSAITMTVVFGVMIVGALAWWFGQWLEKAPLPKKETQGFRNSNVLNSINLFKLYRRHAKKARTISHEQGSP